MIQCPEKLAIERNLVLDIMLETCDELLKHKGDRVQLARLAIDARGLPQGVCCVTRVIVNQRCNKAEETTDVRHDRVLLRRAARHIGYEFANQWEPYSGDKTYPVPHPKLLEDDAFENSEFDDMWMKGEYAESRWDYIVKMREWLLKEIV